MTRLLFVALFLTSCASSLKAPARRPDGGFHLECGAALAQCLKQAEDLCKGRGFVVIGGFSRRTLYGAELGVSQVEERQSELDIGCADRRGDLPKVEMPASPPKLERPAEAAPLAPTPSSVPPAVAPSAVPAPAVPVTGPSAPNTAPPGS